MRRTIATALAAAALAAGCATEVAEPTTTTTTEAATEVDYGCVRVGSADVDPSIGNVAYYNGWNVAYVDGTWNVGGLSGTAATEDAAVTLCGSLADVGTVEAEQDDICAAGNAEVCALRR